MSNIKYSLTLLNYPTNDDFFRKKFGRKERPGKRGANSLLQLGIS
jgi:hypothetical protein